MQYLHPCSIYRSFVTLTNDRIIGDKHLFLLAEQPKKGSRAMITAAQEVPTRLRGPFPSSQPSGELQFFRWQCDLDRR